MEIEHYIITRFYNAKIDQRVNLLDEKLLKDGISLLKRYLIPSLENQTEKRFTHILLINELHKELLIFRDLQDLHPNYNLKILTNSEFDEYRNSFGSNVIISRIDLDDAIYNEAVADTRAHFDPGQKLKFYGYRNGMTMEDTDHSICYETNVLYPGGGTNSQFQSIMFNDFTNYKGPVSFDHSNVYNFLRSNNVQISNKTYEVNSSVSLAYIWTIRDLAWHIVGWGQSRRQSNKKVLIAANTLKERFGIE